MAGLFRITSDQRQRLAKGELGLTYEIIPLTKDFFLCIKTNKEGAIIYYTQKGLTKLAIYRVDIANNTCSCDNFQFQPMEKKKHYKCRHLKMCGGVINVK